MKKFLKVLFSLFLGFIALIIVAILLFSYITHSNNTEKKYTINVLKSKISDSPKALVVYQPSKMSSLTKDISDNIAKGLNSKGYQVTITYPGKKVSADISKYDIIVLGSPVYIGSTSSVLSDYIRRIGNFQDKKVVLFVTGANDDSVPLNSLGKSIHNSKLTKKLKFKKDDETKAYNLGCEIGEK